MAKYASILEDPTIPKLDRLPEGWVRTNGAQTAPIGWYWANNGKSIMSGERKTALVREEA